MSSRPKTPIDVEELSALAKRFAERRMFDEASDLFQLALRFEPANMGLKLNLAQVRQQQKQTRRSRDRDTEEAIRERLRRGAIDAAHFFGLGALYEERTKRDQAIQCLEIARQKSIANPYVHKLLAKIHFKDHRYDQAADELRVARRFNPFDRESAELTGRVEYERENYRRALEATIDAFLLLEENDREGSDRLKKRIRTLKTIRRISSQEIVELFRQRREKLQTDFDRLEWQRERLLREDDHHEEEEEAEPVSQAGRIELAARLREIPIWQALDDEQIFHLTRAAEELRVPRGTVLFEHGSDGRDIYVLRKGRISIRRRTHYGNYHLGSLLPGVAFGEANFIARHERTADAVGAADSMVVRLDAEELESVMEDHPDLGLRLYQSFWQGLAQKLRGANEQLRTFFSGEMPESLVESRRAAREKGGDVEVEEDTKVQLFVEQGLTAAELTTLANFSEVKRFPGGTYLFHEGDEGEQMYVVLEGKVMISKYIPGGGEEALAILERGDFFGEMSLVDGQPRSADAKAFQGPATVVAFDERTLDEVMSMDPNAALQFMTLLCRLICKRLREIDEKVIGWRIMSGARSDDETTPDPEPLPEARSSAV